jgi:hypothetical protein
MVLLLTFMGYIIWILYVFGGGEISRLPGRVFTTLQPYLLVLCSQCTGYPVV